MKSGLRALITCLMGIWFLQPVNGQPHREINFGISTMTGRNFYDKKYYDQDQLAPGWETYYKTNYLWAGSIWLEKYLNKYFTTMTEVRYTTEDVSENMLCQCNLMNEVLQTDEKHYWGIFNVGLRYYINPASKVAFFADAGAELDWFIAAREKRYFMDEHMTKKILDWNALGYKRFVPSTSFSVGVKWKRLALHVGGMTNLARSMVRNPGTYDQVVYPVKTGFFGKGFFVKTTFTLFKLR